MRIAVDAMGGDFAPREIVRGAVEASRAWPELEIVLLGDEKRGIAIPPKQSFSEWFNRAFSENDEG